MHTSNRRTARLVGWLFIGTFVFSIPGYLLYGPLLGNAEYVLGAGHDTQISAGAFLEILTAIANIGTAVALYPVARRYSHRLGLSYVAVRILESTIIVAGIASVMAVVTLRQEFAGSDPEVLSIAAGSMVAFHDWTFLLGPSFCAAFGNGLILGWLMFKTGLLPRRVAGFGIFAGTFALIAASGVLFDAYDAQSTPHMLLTFPEMVWELTFGIYLITKGFTAPERRTAIKRPGIHVPAAA